MEHAKPKQNGANHDGMKGAIWLKLSTMTATSFVAMYLLMYSMIDSIDDLLLSINQAYMAGSMAAAMVAIELIVMGSMYKNRAVRFALIVASIILTLALVILTRYQTAIDDHDFLRSMIPHHSGAILMCKNEELRDQEIINLCREITESQRSEIDQMNAIRMRLSR
jgi:uncharacterized protein (DUF305 family)